MRSKKFFLYLVLSVLCLFLIFSFSSKDSDISNGTSKGLIDKGIVLCERITHKSYDHEKIIKKLNYPVRKLAHYSIYFILGFLIYQVVLYSSIKKGELVAIVLSFCYAVFDEVHQLFVSGRTGQVKDILIDTLGAITAVFLVRYLRMRRIKMSKVQVDDMIKM